MTSALVGEWSVSRSGRFTPGERGPGTHWIGGWVGPRTGLDDMQKRKFLPLPGLELLLLGRLARSQLLHQPRLPTCGWENIKMGLKEMRGEAVSCIHLVQDSIGCEHDNEPSGCIQLWEFIEWLCFLRTYSAPWSCLASSADCQGVTSEKKTPYGVATGWSPRPVSVCTVANV
jgi:hypothetical protein